MCVEHLSGPGSLTAQKVARSDEKKKVVLLNRALVSCLILSK